MRTLHHRLIVASVSVAGFLAATAAPVAAGPISTGTYTFTYGGTAPPNTTDRITAKGLNGQSYDFNLGIGGLNSTQATNLLLGRFPSGSATLNGMNSVTVTDPKLTKIDGGTNMAGYGPVLGGTVDHFQAPHTRFAFTFDLGQDPTQGVTVAGAISIDITGVGLLSTNLGVGTTSEQAATAVYNLLQSNGFSDVQAPILTSDGYDVAFSLSPTGSSLGGAEITSVDSFGFDGANLHYGLVLPQGIPEPSSIVMSGMAAIAGLGYWWRRRRSPAVTR